MSKYIHRSGTTLPPTNERERKGEGGELCYSLVDALLINTVGEIMKVLSAEPSATSWFIMRRGRGGA